MNSLLVVGARVFVYINGQKWAKCTSLEFDSVTPHKAAIGLDFPDPFELMPTTNQIRGQLTCLRSVGDGGLESIGLTAPFTYLPRQKYFSLTVIDRQFDMIIFQADSCLVLDQKWQIAAKGIMAGAIIFEGLNWVNESFGYYS
jgi:hypothetical protein